MTESEALRGPARPEPTALRRALTVTRRAPTRPADRPNEPHRPRPTRVALALACVALAAAGSAVGFRTASQHLASPHGWTASAAPLLHPSWYTGTAITASVQVTAASWGSTIELRMEHVQPGYICSMVVLAQDGHQETAGTWSAPLGGPFTISGTASVPPEQVASIQVNLPNGTTLVSLTRPGDGPHT